MILRRNLHLLGERGDGAAFGFVFLLDHRRQAFVATPREVAELGDVRRAPVGDALEASLEHSALLAHRGGRLAGRLERSRRMRVFSHRVVAAVSRGGGDVLRRRVALRDGFVRVGRVRPDVRERGGERAGESGRGRPGDGVRVLLGGRAARRGVTLRRGRRGGVRGVFRFANQREDVLGEVGVVRRRHGGRRDRFPLLVLRFGFVGIVGASVDRSRVESDDVRNRGRRLEPGDGRRRVSRRVGVRRRVGVAVAVARRLGFLRKRLAPPRGEVVREHGRGLRELVQLELHQRTVVRDGRLGVVGGPRVRRDGGAFGDVLRQALVAHVPQRVA